MNTSLDKAGIVAALYSELDHSRDDCRIIVEVIFEIIKSKLEDGEDVKLPGFGIFSVRSKRSRIGRNPKTGEETMITARKVVTFKPSPSLKDRVERGAE